MSERRSHWDDDLIVAVGDAIEHADPTVYPTVGMVNDVIAAVEDWQIAKAGSGKYAITLGVIGGKYLPEWIAQSAIDRATKAEATIARVREEVDSWPASLDKTIAACANSVLNALEGDSNE